MRVARLVRGVCEIVGGVWQQRMMIPLLLSPLSVDPIQGSHKLRRAMLVTLVAALLIVTAPSRVGLRSSQRMRCLCCVRAHFGESDGI